MGRQAIAYIGGMGKGREGRGWTNLSLGQSTGRI